ncbi:MAG: hypothetical protein PHU25_12430 [Deltaproteobacteria bacterium]|nr:hypothetical protein [Deltaproteobacteria bacterium]
MKSSPIAGFVPVHGLAALLVAIASALYAFADGGVPPGSPPRAVERLVAGERRLSVDDGSLRWVWDGARARTGVTGWRPAVFLAAERDVAGAGRDLYTAEIRVTADGRPRAVRRLANLSVTADADEDVLAVNGNGRVAFAARLAQGYRGVTLIDFRGEPRELTEGWSRWWRIANAITNYQKTGRFEGVYFRHFVFQQPPAKVSLAFRGAELVVGSDAGAFTVAADGRVASPIVVAQEMVKGRPALLAWTVDTLRAVPWIGPDRVARLEKVWFDLNDWLARAAYEIAGDDPLAYEDVVVTGTAAKPAQGLPGWPPAPIAPKLKPSLAGEGKWAPVDDGIFTPDVAGPPLFYSTFLRVDPERRFAPVFITAWDPSRVGLRMMAGVQEPQSTTGLHGAGEVPRKPGPRDDVSRLVGAFNGAFQALHGEWGMVLDKMTFLPPLPYGATVAVMDDGSVSMGTWPDPIGDLPDGMRDLRQNLNPLVEGGVVNAYKRKWWGGVAPGADDQVFTQRTGLCLTKGGKLMFFWGENQSPERLGEAMVAAGCDYGMHLDMNSGHCGFEFYRVDRTGGQPAFARPLNQYSEDEGGVPRRPDLVFRARRMTSRMSHMRFPRYIGRDPRDFFYLVRNPSLFDRPPQDTSGGTWAPVEAREGYPVAAVSAGNDQSLRLMKFDPSQIAVSVEDAKPQDALAAVPFGTSAAGISTGLVRNKETLHELQGGEPALVVDGAGARLVPAEEVHAGDVVVQGLSPAVSQIVASRDVLGADPDGDILFASGAGGSSLLVDSLEKLEARTIFGLIPPATGGDIHWLVVRARPKAAWSRIFPEVKPVPPSVWHEAYRQRGNLLDHDPPEKD